MSDGIRHLAAILCLSMSILAVGCAGPRSMVVLLPEEGKAAGEVTVTNTHGTRLLKGAWQSVEISGPDRPPADAAAIDQGAVRDIFAGVLSTMPLPPAHFTLFFNFDSVELTPDSAALLQGIVGAIAQRSPAELSVVGHADTTGGAEYNMRLGLMRANAVTALLRSLGANPVSVRTSSRGETDPLVRTGDRTPEPRNRRAEVGVR